MVVDGGEWGAGVGIDSTEPWETYVTTTENWSNAPTGTNFSEPVVNGFDGDTSTMANGYPAGGSWIYFTPPEAITGVTSLRIYCLDWQGISLNGVQSFVPTTPSVSGDAGWVTVNSPPNSITQIAVQGLIGPSSGRFSAIEINGEVLVSSAVAGDTHVEYQTNGGEGTIISTDPDTNTLVVADTGDRDNRWIKGFSVAGPSVIDTPLLTNDVELRGSDFATTPADADTLKEIVWSINGTEYSAGVTNPWSPLEKLPTNSTVTVKVKYKGNTLEDSDWSPDVTFTTGASMRSLFSRIAALEANDVTDDATDTALITLIAGLAARIQALEEAN